MKSKHLIKSIVYTIAILVVLHLFVGCYVLAAALVRPNWWLESYQVTTEIDSQKIQEIGKSIGEEIEKTLDCEALCKTGDTIMLRFYPKTQEPGIIVGVYFLGHPNPKHNILRVYIRKAGSEATNGLIRIQRTIENNLRKRGYTWRSEVTHSTLN